MLQSIDIRNFAIIKSLQLDWRAGMTVITGETGAGKSIVIDALGLTLGERAEQTAISPGASQAEVSAIFSIDAASSGYQWLQENDLLDDYDSEEVIQPQAEFECILRRVIIKGGRSKCYINGRNVTQAQLKGLGVFLVDIHGQHAHQSLLKNKEQLNLLDRFANHQDLISNVTLAYQQLNTIREKKKRLEAEKQTRDSQRELLVYQVEELEQSNPEQSVLDELEISHQKAATSQDRLLIASEAMNALSTNESGSVLGALTEAISQISKLLTIDPTLHGIAETLTDAESLLQDANQELQSYSENLECDPERLLELDQQLSQFHDLARKHHVALTELPAHFSQLQNDLQQLQSDDDALIKIQKEYNDAEKTYLCQAKLLTASRTKIARTLEKKVTAKIQPLAMEGGQFSIQIKSKDSYSSLGLEDIEYLVSANPGQPLQPLNKVASGGELSRISLAISTITSEHQLVPCIIFDEVDVGIGGATAETVGLLLQQLADKRQVLCVTHQPQVASCGNQHLVASKTKLSDSTTTEINELDQKQRIEEIARMLGGKVISDKTISHAKEMLKL
ncbi:MAG: DNA repair protein RecN [Kangiellaceae bacterium]|nr:DNA repair protein RecN [Kangiellaceae bacterium]